MCWNFSLGFWRLNARKPVPLLGTIENCTSKVSKSGFGVGPITSLIPDS
jgi:hypothetical protein